MIPLPVVTRDAETQKPLFQGLADAFKAKWGRVLFVRFDDVCGGQTWLKKALVKVG